MASAHSEHGTTNGSAAGPSLPPPSSSQWQLTLERMHTMGWLGIRSEAEKREQRDRLERRRETLARELGEVEKEMSSLDTTIGNHGLLPEAFELILHAERALESAQSIKDALLRGESHEATAQLVRESLIEHGAGQRISVSLLGKLQPDGLPTSRSHFLRSITDIIKPTGRAWDDETVDGEWVHLILEGLRQGDISLARDKQGRLVDTPLALLLRQSGVDIEPSSHACALEALGDEAAQRQWVLDHFLPDQALADAGGSTSLERMEHSPWQREHARTYRVLSVFGKNQICRALQERDPRFAACTYAIYDALIRRKEQNEERRRQQSHQRLALRSTPPPPAPESPSAGLVAVAVASAAGSPDARPPAPPGRPPQRSSPKLYAALHGPQGLAAVDKGWAHLLEPDNHGFIGLTSHALVEANCRAGMFRPEGISTSYVVDSGLPTERRIFTGVSSDVVCFQSNPTDKDEHHAAIMISERNGVFPPNTLFRYESVHEKGFYPEDEDGNTVLWDPRSERSLSLKELRKAGLALSDVKKLFVRQRLITVTATYKLLPQNTDKWISSKHCGSVIMLVYGTREAYIAGNDEILGKPVLTMQQECERTWSFEDWKGVKHRLRDLWEYVNGVARSKEGETAGTRDARNDGKSVQDFYDEVSAIDG